MNFSDKMKRNMELFFLRALHNELADDDFYMICHQTMNISPTADEARENFHKIKRSFIEQNKLRERFILQPPKPSFAKKGLRL